MKACNNYNVVSFKAIEDAIREAAQQGASDVSVNDRKLFRMDRYRCYGVVDGLQELFAQP